MAPKDRTDGFRASLLTFPAAEGLLLGALHPSGAMGSVLEQVLPRRPCPPVSVHSLSPLPSFHPPIVKQL